MPKLLHTFENGQTLWLHESDPTPPPPPVTVLALGQGAQLLVDDYVIESAQNIKRVVVQPARTRAAPILTNTAPYHVRNFNVCVLYDPVSDLWRMWYGAYKDAVNPHANAFAQSLDGITWGGPNILDVPSEVARQFGPVIDTGAGPTRFQSILRGTELPPLWTGEFWTSPDGVIWTRSATNPVVSERYGETWSLFRREGAYGLIHRWNKRDFAWVDRQGVEHLNTARDRFVRTMAITVAPTINNFPPSTVLFEPGAGDDGETQFYSVSNIIYRNGLYLGIVNILRDDLVAEGAIDGAYGMGYSVLMWSRDGINWSRDNEPFFLPNPLVGTWDHAHSWITSLVPLGGEVVMYYGGYQHGHKVYTDRQIGRLSIKADRYVARRSTGTNLLTTKPVSFSAGSILVNSKGRVRVAVTDVAGQPLPGMGFADNPAITGDQALARVAFGGRLATVSGPVRLAFELSDADLYSFRLAP